MIAPLIGITTAHRQRRHPPPVTLAAIPATYVQAVAQAGGVPILIPLGIGEEGLKALVDRLDGLLLPGGEDVEPGLYGEPPHPRLGKVDPERDRLEIAVTRLALDVRLPILALCRGHQVLNVALGGSLYQDIPSQWPEAIVHQAPNRRGPGASHLITVDAGSRLAQIIGPGPMMVNSFHHQAIKELAPGLVATAWAPDGLIEAVEMPDHPFCLGVQWHPEEMVRDHPPMRALFRAFVAACQDDHSTKDHLTTRPPAQTTTRPLTPGKR